MDLLDNLTSSRPLSSLVRGDVIEYQSDYIPKDTFVVYAKDMDETIPALMVQLWKFSGGYDHGIYNIVVNDLGINTSVPILTPEKIIGKIVKILNYRTHITELTDKEIFIMNMVPKELSEENDDHFTLPYECIIQTDEGEIQLILPDWTPIQKLPIDRINVGTFVEIWRTEYEDTIMRVLKL